MEQSMEQVEKKMRILSRMKWIGFPLGFLMYWAADGAFGETPATILSVFFAGAFFLICEKGRRGVLCEHIIEDLRRAMERLGKLDCIFEIKAVKLGLIVRVYFIKAGEMAPKYGKAVLDAIAGSEYRHRVWVTQVVDLESENDLKAAEMALNDEIIQKVQKKKPPKA